MSFRLLNKYGYQNTNDAKNTQVIIDMFLSKELCKITATS